MVAACVEASSEKQVHGDLVKNIDLESLIRGCFARICCLSQCSIL